MMNMVFNALQETNNIVHVRSSNPDFLKSIVTKAKSNHIVVHLDTQHISSENEFYLYLQDIFSFPEWFGKNSQALVDMLKDLDLRIPVHDKTGYMILWSGYESLGQLDTYSFYEAVIAFWMAIDHWKHKKTSFSIALIGGKVPGIDPFLEKFKMTTVIP